MGRAQHLGIALALSLGVAVDAGAQDEEPKKAAPAEKEGYDGVVPGESRIVPPGAPWRNKRYAPVFWIGFQPRDGASRFFVQLGREVDYDQRLEGNVLFVDLPGARLANSNARRPLVTRYFDSAVAEVRARRVHKRRRKGKRLPAGVELRITFVNPADAARASASQTREADGFTYLYLDFGPGSGAPEAEPASDPNASPDEFE